MSLASGWERRKVAPKARSLPYFASAMSKAMLGRQRSTLSFSGNKAKSLEAPTGWSIEVLGGLR
jgi:hypothetical protein